MDRDFRQNEAAWNWRQAISKGAGAVSQTKRGATIHWATGTGKTRIAILICKMIQEKHPNAVIVCLVPSTPLQVAWKKEFANNNIRADVYDQSAGYSFRLFCDLLILDEIHTTAGEATFELYEKISYKWLLGLTATYQRPDGRHTLYEKYAPVCDVVSRDDALQWGWISDFGCVDVWLKFSDRNYTMLSNDIRTGLKRIGSYEFVRDIIAKKREANKETRNLAFQIDKMVRERNDLVKSAQIKKDKALEIILIEPELKWLVFFEYKADCYLLKEMCKQAGIIAEVYHGKMPKKQKEAIIEALGNKEISVLIACKALDIGITIPNLNRGILAASTSSYIQFNQRIGRFIRKDETGKSMIYRLLLEGTKDESWSRIASKKEKVNPPNLFK